MVPPLHMIKTNIGRAFFSPESSYIQPRDTEAVKKPRKNIYNRLKPLFSILLFTEQITTDCMISENYFLKKTI